MASVILTNRVTWYAVGAVVTSTSIRFQMPVTTSTANAGQAIRLNARAAALVAAGLTRRRLGTTPASANWPPTQIVAAKTWMTKRHVVRVGDSIGARG